MISLGDTHEELEREKQEKRKGALESTNMNILEKTQKIHID